MLLHTLTLFENVSMGRVATVWLASEILTQIAAFGALLATSTKLWVHREINGLVAMWASWEALVVE